MAKVSKSINEPNLFKTLALFFSYLLIVTITNSTFIDIHSTPLAERFMFQRVVISLSLGSSYFILTFSLLYFFIQLFEKTVSKQEVFSFLAQAAFVPYLSLQAILFSVFPKLETFSNPAQVLGFFQGLCFSLIVFRIFYWLRQRFCFPTRQAMTIIIFVVAIFLGAKLFFENFYQISFSFFPSL